MPTGTAPLAEQAVISSGQHRAVIFDLDGVVTDTASVHAAAWRRLFDDFLGNRSEVPGEDHRPFTEEDYLRYVDGRSRFDGVSALLRARGVYLPAGNPGDPPDRASRHGLGNRKDHYFRQLLDTKGVRVFASTVALVRELRQQGTPVAVVSASRNCAAVLAAAGLADLFPVRVDGVLADELHLPGKPEPALFLEAARRLGVPPNATVVVEDARAGVQAGRRGGFGLVIGVDRTGDPGSLRAAGADAVVSDLSHVTVRADAPPEPRNPPTLSQLPDALAVWDSDLARRLAGRRIAVFCDFDGTLSPIVDHPDAAVLPRGTRAVLVRLARHCPVAVISGRDLADVRARVGLTSLWYAGAHGMDLAGPNGEREVVSAAERARPALSRAAAELTGRLAGVPGVFLEPKRFSLSVHYREVPSPRVADVTDAVAEVAAHHPDLTVLTGRKVAELRPELDWNKGRALRWLLDRVASKVAPLPVYAGDDITDEDALREVAGFGLGIVVRSDEHGDRPTAAHVAVNDPGALCRLLGKLADLLEHDARPR
ncbi:MAG TPA: trehalose-phosphatase [Micromonosporaceae bacterium]